jgi:hypothetical protein
VTLHVHDYSCLKQTGGKVVEPLQFNCEHPVGPETAELTRAYNENDPEAFEAIRRKIEQRMAAVLNALQEAK